MPAFDVWTTVDLTMSSEEMPLVAVQTIKGLRHLARVTATAEVRVVKHQVPVTLHEVDDGKGGTHQVVDAVAQYGGQQWRLTFTQTDNGPMVMLESPEGAAPGAQGRVTLDQEASNASG